ncbi:GntR family transcriptional regulator / MocR family aminotransferase [Amycolatopsis arida]|uniref:GntR family transcriptional regulator / MocR family aminotransferase n=1 Tax=Amycolatopsis arida TaxID=587909 RepID=A0A1I5T7W2_9PSEU|nr:hypothetical protein CLV69_103330 [Amycolatopsis arida]SFP79129.1 GntR family transcriptional regulator / MocR family aminotransferase [Amycolatopsis arida]
MYAERRDRIRALPRRDLARWPRVVPSAAGSPVCARIADGVAVDVGEVVAGAARAGVAVEPLGRYCAAAPRPGLVLGYGAIDTARIEAGLARLAGCLAAATG